LFQMSRKRRNAGVFEVESIHGKRKNGGVIQYHVKWRGFNEDQNTWEPQKNLTESCADIIEEWEKQHRDAGSDAPKGSKKRKKSSPSTDNKKTAKRNKDGSFTVESIEQKVQWPTQIKYLVKWEGYDERTWEPVQHLQGGCKELLDAFEEEVKDQLIKSWKELDEQSVNAVGAEGEDVEEADGEPTAKAKPRKKAKSTKRGRKKKKSKAVNEKKSDDKDDNKKAEDGDKSDDKKKKK